MKLIPIPIQKLFSEFIRCCFPNRQSYTNAIILVLMLSLSACADKKEPPLVGNRLNVLHYDLLKEDKQTKVEIKLPKQLHLSSWPASEVSQFADIAPNISLAKEIKFVNQFHPKNFNASAQDASALIVNDVLYTYSKTILSANHLLTKKMLWSVKAVQIKNIQNVFNGSLLYHQGVIYLSSGERDFLAFDATSGKELWRFNAPNVVRHIASIKNNQIYVSSIDNTVSCLGMDGKLLWRYDAPSYSLANSHPYMPNLVYEDKVITITTAGDLVILNRHDGTELTQVNLATTAIIGDGNLIKGPISSPILDGDFLYVLTGEGDLIKLDLASPEISWRQNFPGVLSYWVAGNVSYLLMSDHQLLAVENNQGKIIWAVDLPKSSKDKKLDIIYGPMLVGDQLLVASTNGEFFLLSPYDGKLISRHKNTFSINSMPMAVNDRLYFISNNGVLAIWQ